MICCRSLQLLESSAHWSACSKGMASVHSAQHGLCARWPASKTNRGWPCGVLRPGCVVCFKCYMFCMKRMFQFFAGSPCCAFHRASHCVVMSRRREAGAVANLAAVLKDPHAGLEQGVVVAALALLSALAVDADGREAALAAGVVPAAVRLLRAPEPDLVPPTWVLWSPSPLPFLVPSVWLAHGALWAASMCAGSPSTSWSPGAWPTMVS